MYDISSFMSKFHVTLLTLFPEIFPASLGYSLSGKALENKIWSFDTINIRDFGLTKHKNVDDTPYGGGNGLIMRPDVIGNALDSALKIYPDAKIYYPSPRGKILNQSTVKKISAEKNIIILCGRFEGVDERVFQEYNIEQISIGDYVLSCGEVAAIAILDSVVRLLPGVLSNQDTLKEESFEEEAEGLRLLEHPLYTKPAIWKNMEVPEVLMSGNHAKIKKWKREKSIEITKNRIK